MTRRHCHLTKCQIYYMFLEVFYVCIFLLSSLQNLETKLPFHPKPFKSCFEELGCITTSELWYHEINRPTNLEPLDRHTIRTTFILFRRNQSDQLIYDLMTAKQSSIQVAGFCKGHETVFLIHDFTSNGYTGWIKRLGMVTLAHTPNVISVDWEAGAEPPFPQAVANARVVALEIIAFIKAIREHFGVCEAKIKIFGHGVGAHIAGYVGYAIPNIKKITGLDPTGPYFEGMPIEVKLDKTDAAFVEVIHTDAFYPKSQGTKEQLGHIDFYANNAALQPGCDLPKDYQALTKLDRNTLKEGQVLPDCSHKRSFKYIIEALQNPGCKFLGIPCKDHDSFVEGKCTSCSGNATCAYLGVEPSHLSIDNKLFFNTRDRSPFCLFAYVVEITLSERSSHQTGKFEMMLIGDGDKVANATSVANEKVFKYESGKTHAHIFYASPFKVQSVKEAEVRWTHRRTTLCIMFCSTDIYLKEVQLRLLSKEDNSCKKTRLCPAKPNGKIPSGSYLKFVRCDLGPGH